jgi:hypothetical protein
MIWEGRVNRAVLLSMNQIMDLMVLLLRIAVWAVPVIAVPAVPAAVFQACQDKRVAWETVAAEAALIRAVPLVAEAVVHPAVPLPATVLKVDPAARELARVQVKVKAAPGNNQY